ncbi:MAG: glycosyltransferase, partial [Actinobacteria bacterium]|nr:glycosyltransferase [Actinomycetota bacterium]
MDSPNTPTEITVVHRSLPGPHSADPRDRQVYRRVLDLVSLGRSVTLVPVEPHLPGGAPQALLRAGVRLESGPREPASHRVRRLAARTACWYLTDPAPTESLLEALESVDGPLIVDHERLRSVEMALGSSALRPAEGAGLDYEVEHVRAFEARLLRRASVVLCPTRAVADDVRRVLGDPDGPAPDGLDVRVLPGTTLLLEPGDAPDGLLVLSGRFSDEFATPDESVARSLIDAERADPERVALVGEDTVPRLRRGFAEHFDVVDRDRAWSTTLRCTAVLDVRAHGAPTVARRAELAAAGVPFVVSPTALGDAALPGAAAGLISADPDEQWAIACRLLDDTALRQHVAKDLRELARNGAPEVTRAQLRNLLDDLGVQQSDATTLQTGVSAAQPLDLLEADGEYRRTSLGGTLAAADPRIARLESEMVPLRLHDRETSINLQSTMDADQRYRVFSRTHLEAGPAAAPPVTTESEAIRFSILLPTWNSDEALLAECVRSVKAQQHAAWELCVVDDGSTRTGHLDQLRRWSAEDPRIKVRENRWNQGIAFAS